jgi:hypothetical protein
LHDSEVSSAVTEKGLQKVASRIFRTGPGDHEVEFTVVVKISRRQGLGKVTNQCLVVSRKLAGAITEEQFDMSLAGGPARGECGKCQVQVTVAIEIGRG